MPRRKKIADEFEPSDALQIANHLKAAAAMLPPQATALAEFQAFLDEGMLPHAWEALREAAGEHSVPFAFWSEMSRAADLLGGAP